MKKRIHKYINTIIGKAAVGFIRLVYGITITGKIKMKFENPVTGAVRVSDYDNLITTPGVIAIARRLINEGALANEGIITYGASGTDGTAPTIADTTLGTELARKIVSSVARSANVITITTFFTTAESVGTLAEWGLFGEAATGAADSGTLFEHALISEVKSNSETLTVDVEIKISTAG